MGTRARLLLAVAAIAALAALTAFVVATDAGIAWDEAVYLTRGLYHAAQVSERGFPVVLRLPWSLLFESPKPPLYTGWLALVRLALPEGWIAGVLVAGTVVPLVALAWLVARLARTAGGSVASGVLAVVALAATPLVLEVGTRLLVEATLGGCVVAATWLALERCRRPGAGAGLAVATGAAVGLALLAKLLAPLFLLPVAVLAFGEIGRREGAAAVARWAGLATVVALAIALPWYARNHPAAIEFGRYAARHEPSLYLRPWWTRPGHLLGIGPGLPLATAWIALAIAAAGRAAPRTSPDLARLRRVAGSMAALSAAVIASQPVFDPRYWLSALAVVAAWAGAEADAIWRRGPASRRFVAVVAGALVIFSLARVATWPRARMAWNAPAVVSELHGLLADGKVLCSLGTSAEWNVFKLEAAVELARLRPRPGVSELDATAPREELLKHIGSCAAIFALDPAELSSADLAFSLNRGLESAFWLVGAEGSGFVLDRNLAERLGSRAPVRVFRVAGLDRRISR